MNGENRRSREAVRNSVRTYGVKVMDPASLPLKKTKEKESQESVSRFSEKSLHSNYEIQKVTCKTHFQRVPYATLLGSIFTLAGAIICIITRPKTSSLTANTVRDVFKRDTSVFTSGIDVFGLTLEIGVLVLTAIILIVGVLATGDIRAYVFKGSKGRIAGKFFCALLLILSFAFLVLWMMLFIIYITLSTLIEASKIECKLIKNRSPKTCLFLGFINILFGEVTKPDDYEVCDNKFIKQFCKDYVEKVHPSIMLISIGSCLVIGGLVIYLITLAANYARIREEAKSQDLEDFNSVDLDLVESKNRF